MAYINNIPQATDQLSVSQPQILGNFQAIDTWVGINHVGFNLADSGKHTFVTLQRQVGATPFVSPEVGISNFNLPLTSTSQIWFSYFDSGAVKREYPVTASILSTVPFPTDGSTGWAYLPSGIILKWGTFTGLVAGVNNNLNIGPNPGNSTFGPKLSAIMNVQLTPTANGGVVGYVSSNIAGNPQVVSINVTAPANNVRYFIIGA